MDLLDRTSLAVQIARGLSFLHANNIIHRDLKPNNILLNQDQRGGVGLRALIGDFGLSVESSGSKQHVNSAQGNLLYVSPEVLLGKRSGWPQDVYALGLVMWGLFAGDNLALPKGMSVAGRIMAVTNDHWRPKLPKAMPEALSSLLTRCWHENPDFRPTCQQVQDALALFGEEFSKNTASCALTSARGSAADFLSESQGMGEGEGDWSDGTNDTVSTTAAVS
jgi:serine/threonine protein kinase